MGHGFGSALTQRPGSGCCSGNGYACGGCFYKYLNIPNNCDNGKFPEGWFGGSIGRWTCNGTCTLDMENGNHTNPQCDGKCSAPGQVRLEPLATHPVSPHAIVAARCVCFLLMILPAPSPLHPFQRGHAFDAGDIFLATAVGLFFLYFIVGMIVMRIKGHSGPDMIPNVEFWKDLPTLIMEGFRFTFRCTAGKVRKTAGYTPYESL